MAIRKVEKVEQKKKVYVKPIYEKIEILEKTSLACPNMIPSIDVKTFEVCIEDIGLS